MKVWFGVCGRWGDFFYIGFTVLFNLLEFIFLYAGWVINWFKRGRIDGDKL